MERRLLWFCLLLSPILVWSLINPHDLFTWFLEVAPVLVGFPIAVAFQRRFPLSTLLLWLLWIHCVILIVGGHYTYALVPLGEWMKGWFGWSRNHYDKIGHFAQGFIPAILVRELLLRASPLRYRSDCQRSRWVNFLIVATCLAFSAFYELIEWFAAISLGEAADAFLGTQGDAWDTQTDMFAALIGSLCALVLLSRWHDHSLQKVSPP